MFESKYAFVGEVTFPEYTGTRVMMMPFVIGNLSSIPDFLSHYKGVIQKMTSLWKKHTNEVGYITIDEKTLKPGESLRRSGAHVDGVFQGKCGGWGGGGGWASVGNGMLTASSVAGCKVWGGKFDGLPGYDGECEHLIDDRPAEVIKAGQLFWLDGLCVHESLPMETETPRQFIRLSMPSTAPWFEGYTENPLGVKPTGEILPKRKYMSS